MRAVLQLVRDHKAGGPVGMYSVCSAHALVLEAAMREAASRDAGVLIEATANQVNQFGGYTGMTPAAFQAFAAEIAAKVGLPASRLLLGGDHLGPTCWRADGAAIAMKRSTEMVAAYVDAGFRKLHLDCSMPCADDPAALSDEVIAARAADLCAAAELAANAAGGEPPVYVIGTEVPAPGGAAEPLDGLAVTTPAAVDVTLAAHRNAFAARGLEAVWPRVVALVVQPGVEFDNHKVVDYAPAKARALSARIEREASLVYEAHSTDYQTAAALRALVEDHFAILKVGPALTFALRESLWALSDIAHEMGHRPAQSLKQSMIDAMRGDPRHWRTYYTVPQRETFDLQYSLSDRLRYYWNAPGVRAAVASLMRFFAGERMPLALLSQYRPVQYAAIRAGTLDNDAHAVLLHGVEQVLRDYVDACGPSSAGAHPQRPRSN